ALEKIPADRFESAKAFGDALVNPAFQSHAPQADSATVATSARNSARFWIPTTVAAVMTLAFVISFVHQPAPAPEKPMRFSIARMPTLAQYDQGLSISRDGKVVAYLATIGGVSRVYRRALGDVATQAVPETEGVVELTLSPDGNSVAVEGADDHL